MSVMKLYRWTRREYARLIDHGILDEDDRSEPEPDVSVIRGAPRDYVHTHPTHPVLVVEVAVSGLAVARGRKARAYARGGITDYWIVNLVDRVVEVYRDPTRTPATRRRWGYASVETRGADASITPLDAPAAAALVSELLP